MKPFHQGVLLIAGTVAAAMVVTLAMPALSELADGSDGSDGPRQPPKEAVEALPDNTPRQLALVRTCMIGDPSISVPVSEDSLHDVKVSGPGTRVSDFRVLATSERDRRGRTVLLGSPVAYRTCTLDRDGVPSRSDVMPHQAAFVWGVPLDFVPKGVIFDRDSGTPMSSGEGGGAGPSWEWHIAGRVVPGGTRVTFTAPDGRSVEAPVTGRFFVLRRTGPGLRGPDGGGQIQASVRLYDGDRVIKEFSTQMPEGILRR